MLISNLQQFLRSLAPALAAAGINSTAQKGVDAGLGRLADALEPFGSMTTEQLAELVEVARSYRESGELPDWATQRKPQPRGTKPAKEPKPAPAEVVARLRDLMERSSDLEPAEINREVEALSKHTGAELKAIQVEFLGGAAGKNKKEQLAEIGKKIHSFRGSRDRGEAILAR